MKDSRWYRNLIFSLLIIPTHDSLLWKLEKFSQIPQNTVSFSEKGILIQVDKSASPLFYSLKKGTKVKGFKVKGDFLGLPEFSDISKQGLAGQDDYPLRIGFILNGEKTLSGLKKMFAPNWVKHLFENTPKDSGIDFVQFFNVTQNISQLGKKRIHPASNLMEEDFFIGVQQPGAFEYSKMFPQPLDSLAIWVSIDGDDTKSKYDVRIKNLELEIVD